MQMLLSALHQVLSKTQRRQTLGSQGLPGRCWGSQERADRRSVLVQKLFSALHQVVAKTRQTLSGVPMGFLGGLRGSQGLPMIPRGSKWAPRDPQVQAKSQRRQLLGTLVAPWQHPGGTLLALWHPGGTLLAHWWHPGRPLLAPWWHPGGTLVASWWHPAGGTLVAPQGPLAHWCHPAGTLLALCMHLAGILLPPWQTPCQHSACTLLVLACRHAPGLTRSSQGSPRDPQVLA